MPGFPLNQPASALPGSLKQASRQLLPFHSRTQGYLFPALPPTLQERWESLGVCRRKRPNEVSSAQGKGAHFSSTPQAIDHLHSSGEGGTCAHTSPPWHARLNARAESGGRQEESRVSGWRCSVLFGALQGQDHNQARTCNSSHQAGDQRPAGDSAGQPGNGLTSHTTPFPKR